MIAQIPEATKAATDTLQNFGLGVGVLIILVVVLGLIIFWAVRMLMRWLKPMVEKFFETHLATMTTVQDSIKALSKNSDEQLVKQKEVASILAESTRKTAEQDKNESLILTKISHDQAAGFSFLIEATNTTNKLLQNNGSCQAKSIEELPRRS